MKKIFNTITAIVFIPALFLISCNKSDSLQQIQSKNAQEFDDEAARNHGCGPGCPVSVPEAMSISYAIDIYNAPSSFGVSVDVFYKNESAAGTFRVVLKKATGDYDTVSIVPALVTAPGQTNSFHLSYSLPADAFPCNIYVTGRPLNLRCNERIRKSFEINNDVSKQH